MDSSVMIDEYGRRYRQDPITNLYSEIIDNDDPPSSPVQRPTMTDVFMGASSPGFNTPFKRSNYYPDSAFHRAAPRATTPEDLEFFDAEETFGMISDNDLMDDSASTTATQKPWTVSSVGDLNDDNRVMEIADVPDETPNTTQKSSNNETAKRQAETARPSHLPRQIVADTQDPTSMQSTPQQSLPDQIMQEIIARGNHQEQHQPITKPILAADQHARKQPKGQSSAQVIPPLSMTGNAFEHHPDGGEAWMDQAAEEGLRNPDLMGYGEWNDVSRFSRHSTPEEADDESPASTQVARTPFTPINQNVAGADPEATIEPPAKKRKTEKSSVTPLKQDSSDKLNVPEAHRKHLALHEKAKSIRPPHTVSESRYWIGVVKFDTPLHKVKTNEEIMWFKGHRLTCVKTIFHMYKQHAIPPGDFKLQLRNELPNDGDIMEELDLYGDRQITLQCIISFNLEDSDDDE
ncbi:Hypothetical protein D9617_10g074400 [Elsinoe fawcettii]|nr:Hypothetical protein D9617_10g074400 [Elsinoe fawcettii]